MKVDWEYAQAWSPQPWMDHSICATHDDPDLWFRATRTANLAELRESQRICANCPVTAQCLEYALAENIHEGIWGGATPTDRRNITRRSKRSKK